MYIIWVILSVYYRSTNVRLINIMNEAHCSGIQSLRVSCWNMRGLSGSLPFVNYLLNDSDICIVL